MYVERVKVLTKALSQLADVFETLGEMESVKPVTADMLHGAANKLHGDLFDAINTVKEYREG